MADANALKEEGNEAFKGGHHHAAAGLYDEGVRTAQAAAASEGGAGVNALLIALQANAAAALLKLERWKEAAERASAALELDGAHAKALYRRGVAYLELSHHSEAKRDLTQAIRLDPSNRDAREALARLTTERSAHKAAQRAKFRDGFGRGLCGDESRNVDEGGEAEETIVEAWRHECDRLRLQLGRCVVEVGDMPWERAQMLEDEESKPRMGGYDLMPISLEEFKRQRMAQRAREAQGDFADVAAPVAEPCDDTAATLPSNTLGHGRACTTCGGALDDCWRNCSVCDAEVCDGCPMHTDPRDECEGICHACGPNAWNGTRV